MKIKHIYMMLAVTICTACNDLLDKYPLDQVTEAVFWNSAKDVELYANRFYICLPDHRKNIQGGTFTDDNSDNRYTTAITWLNGTRSVPANTNIPAESGDMWVWENIRNVNYFFDNYTKTPVNFDAIKQYVGEMHFFKAWYYFDLLKKFGDLPWYTSVLHMDSEELYAPRLSRSVVMDSICWNLDKAAKYLSDRSSVPQDHFSKDLALAFKARVCLFEGNWEKYHAGTVFGVEGEDGTRFLQMAVAASQEVMKKGYELYTYQTGNDYMKNYLMLFNQSDYSANKEVLFFKKYDKELNYTHSLEYHGWDSYATLSLVNQYLCMNGEPIFRNGSKNPEYEGEETLHQLVSKRDPRLQSLIYLEDEPMYIDFQTMDTLQYTFIKLKGDKATPTGFNRKKGSTFDYAQYGNEACITAAITMRYAEILLIFAEAKAELGILTQADLDQSVNLLKKRVGMPDLKMNITYTDPNWEFPQLSPLLNEIRRERRVELAFEGVRNDDICRWAAADELIVGKRMKGFHFNQYLYPDIMPGRDIFLDDKGYLDPLQKQLPKGYGFDVNKDYLYPIPTEELVLNKNLKQNPGWDK